ncbi:MAG: O-antigen polymerase [Dorea sp.]
MRERNKIILEYGTYMLSFFVSYIASLAKWYYASGIILIVEAIYLYVHWVRESGSFVELRALFTLAWVGGQGISCLKLSTLQDTWSYITWLSFFVIYIAFGIGYEWGRKYSRVEGKEPEKNKKKADRLFRCIMLLLVVSAGCFVIEIIRIGYIPVFSDEPYSYSYFRMSALHYLHYCAISCILIPGLTVLWKKIDSEESKWRNGAIIIANIVAFAVPFLYVSRFQFLFEIGVAAVIYILVNKNMRKSTLVLLGLVVCAAYVVITLSQKRDAIYLNNVFKMKYTHMPVFLTQPYIYIANNYDNFDCLVKNLPKFSYGLRMLFPFVSLTGLKFVMPNLVPATVYLTSTELTTFTMFYDAYYDFGVIGVFVIALLIGVVAKVIIDIIKKSDNPVVYLLYGQIAVYLALAFFTTWFSSPATWFWLIITGMIYCYVGYDKK